MIEYRTKRYRIPSVIPYRQSFPPLKESLLSLSLSLSLSLALSPHATPVPASPMAIYALSRTY